MKKSRHMTKQDKLFVLYYLIMLGLVEKEATSRNEGIADLLTNIVEHYSEKLVKMDSEKINQIYHLALSIQDELTL